MTTVPTLQLAIANALYTNSARLLPDICLSYGLKEGTYDEAYSSKRSYVMKRLYPLPEGKLIEIAEKILRDYPTDNLEAAIFGMRRDKPVDAAVSAKLIEYNEPGIYAAWQRALERREKDPEAAITSARTLLESVCKHIIEEDKNGASYEEKDDLPKLYRTAASSLRLAPDQHTEEVFRRILGGCQSVVEGIGTMRNKLSDAHGRGKSFAAPTARHATLAVNLAGAMATFLVATLQVRQREA